MTRSDDRFPASLGQFLRAARLRSFVGRHEELAQFRSALDGPADSFAVLFLTGPGGIGKSTLLRRFGEEARAAGRPVIELDGRHGERTPSAFEADAAEALTSHRPVLLVDTFEAYRPLEGWLRECFLPRLPAGSLVALAGRRPPGDAWRAEPGWAEILRVLRLADLPRDEAIALLAARGVRPARRPDVVAFAGGHPLALSLAAEVAVRDFGHAGAWTPTPDVIGMLVSRLVGEVPSPAHWRALEIAAYAGATDEGLLRSALPEADAWTLFRWLRGLPFMESAPGGIFPHDVVREVLAADMRWRDPRRGRAVHRRILSHLIDRVRRTRGTGADELALSDALLFLQRDGFLPGWYDGGGRQHVVEDAFSAGDREGVLRMAAKEGTETTVAIVRHWLDRQPGAFHVYRDAGTGDLLGFLTWLRLTERREEDEGADPVVAAAWEHLRGKAPLREGEHIAVGRFMVSVQPSPSPVFDVISTRTLAQLFVEGLAWSCTVMKDPELVRGHGYFAHAAPPPTVWVDGRQYGLFGNDWREVPLEEWLDRMDRMNAGDWDPPPEDPATGTAARARLSRPEFDKAIRNALRSWHRPDALAANPLLHTRLAALPPGADPVASLRAALTEAVDRLRGDRQGDKLHRAVTAAFFDSAPTQEAAAERLGLPFGTYRRHLSQGIDRVCELLWHREPGSGDPPAE
ncbi:ATP-binding protein [Streptomyces sp. NPDC002643]